LYCFENFEDFDFEVVDLSWDLIDSTDFVDSQFVKDSNLLEKFTFLLFPLGFLFGLEVLPDAQPIFDMLIWVFDLRYYNVFKFERLIGNCFEYNFLLQKKLCSFQFKF